MAFAALAARRAIATSSRIADIPRPSMAVHTRQLFGAVRVLSPSGSSHRREAALGLGAKRFLSSPGEGEFEDAVARSKSLSNPVRYLGPESPKNLPIVRRILPLGAAIFLSMPSISFRIFSSPILFSAVPRATTRSSRSTLSSSRQTTAPVTLASQVLTIDSQSTTSISPLTLLVNKRASIPCDHKA